MLIAISGNLGTGKTTLISSLAEYRSNVRPFVERSDTNPYRDKISMDVSAMLGFELFYLFECANAYVIASDKKELVILERTFEENIMFGRKFLSDIDRDLFETICSFLVKTVIYPPDLVIYLEASLSTITHNIDKRKTPHVDTARVREYPRLMIEDYEAYKTTFVMRHSHMVIDMDCVNFAYKDMVGHQVIEAIWNRIDQLLEESQNGHAV